MLVLMHEVSKLLKNGLERHGPCWVILVLLFRTIGTPLSARVPLDYAPNAWLCLFRGVSRDCCVVDRHTLQCNVARVVGFEYRFDFVPVGQWFFTEALFRHWPLERECAEKEYTTQAAGMRSRLLLTLERTCK